MEKKWGSHSAINKSQERTQESRASLLHLARVRNGPMHRAYGHAAADLSLICKSIGSIRHLSSYCPLAVTDLLRPSTSSPLQSTPIFLSLWLMLFTIRNPHLLVAHLLQSDALRLWSCTVLFLPPFSNARNSLFHPLEFKTFISTANFLLGLPLD